MTWPGKFLFRNRTFAISDASISLRDIVVNRDRYVVLRYQTIEADGEFEVERGRLLVTAGGLKSGL
jgi:hypothetical protein